MDSAGGQNRIVFEIVRSNVDHFPEETRQLVGDRPVYSFSLTSGKTSITDFGGGAAFIRIPYRLGTGEDPNAVVVCCMDDAGNPIPVTGKYDGKT